MKPNLLLLNGNPGMGKSTLAQRYADEHPMALNLEVDRIWHMMGQWQANLAESSRLKITYTELLANAHMAQGYDVIVPDVFEQAERCSNFEHIAQMHGAVFKEFVLLSTVDDAVERCKTRGRAMGYADGFRPGGALDTHGREVRLQQMYANILQVTTDRPATTPIQSIYGKPGDAYDALIEGI